MAEETGKRKIDHIRICLDEKAQAKKATAGFEDIQFVHRALPETDKAQINLETTFLGKKFSAPLIVGAMTGGAEEATKINASIAEAVEKLGLGMGLGSQRAAIEKPALEKTYRIAREKAPHAFLIANIGGIQLVNGYGRREVKKIVEMIDADAVAIHLNALQEAIQPEGQTNFKGITAKIEEISGTLDIPLIVKETGCGISAEDAEALESAGASAIDIGGLGGTSFSAVEYYRTRENSDKNSTGQLFWDWGIPTVISLIEVTKTVKIPVIASGGIRSGIDMAKSVALGASITSLAQPVLAAAIESEKKTEEILAGLISQLRNVMFLTGVNSIRDLQKTCVIITGHTSEWLKARGFT